MQGAGSAYYDGEHLKKLRVRTYFRQIIPGVGFPGLEGNIDFEGAFQVDIINSGTTIIFFTDGAGNEYRMNPSGSGTSLPGLSELKFPGSPEICRDDILHYRFDIPGPAGEMFIRFHRVVDERDDQNYPVNNYAV